MKLTANAVRVAASLSHRFLAEAGNALNRKVRSTFPDLNIGFCRYDKSAGEIQLFAVGDRSQSEACSQWLTNQGVENRITYWHGVSDPYNPRSKSGKPPALFKLHTTDFEALIKFLDMDPHLPSWKYRSEYQNFQKAYPHQTFGLNPRSKTHGDTKEKIQYGYDLIRHFHASLSEEDALGWNYDQNGRLSWHWYKPHPKGFDHGVDVDISWEDLDAEASGNPEGDWPGGIGFLIRAKQGAKRKSWEYQIPITATLERAEFLARHAANTIKKTFGLTQT
jgi:hypothetical protein